MHEDEPKRWKTEERSREEKWPGEQQQNQFILFYGNNLLLSISRAENKHSSKTLTWLPNGAARPIRYWQYFNACWISSYFFFTLSWPNVPYLICVGWDGYGRRCLFLIYVFRNLITHLLLFVAQLGNSDTFHSRWKVTKACIWRLFKY